MCDELASPRKVTGSTGKANNMGDKGGKKDRDKSQKQKATKQVADTKAKQDKAPKAVPK